MNGSKLRDNKIPSRALMTISELMAALERRLQKHGDIKVKITWEGITQNIEQDNIYLSKDGSLFIDADHNSYKNDFAVDPSET